MDDEHYDALLVIITQRSRRVTLPASLPRSASRAAEEGCHLTQIYRRLMELHEVGRKAVVLIDEANMLQQRELMEELRGFLNLEVPGSKLITFILFGLPSLDALLALDTPLTQRVAVKCRLSSLSPETSKAYILHRLKVAGATREIF
jgi:type II secretory pathway predicted ATPase ExeA